MNLIYRSFDLDIEEGSIFLDISKVSGRFMARRLNTKTTSMKKRKSNRKTESNSQWLEVRVVVGYSVHYYSL